MKHSGWLAVLAVLAVGPMAAAQQRGADRQVQQGSGENRPATRPGDGSGRDSFQQAQLSRLKDLLGSTDEEWKVLEPRLAKVQDLLRDSASKASLGSGRGRRGGFGGPLPTDTTPSAVQLAAKELQDDLAKKDTSPDELKSKLTALREARARSQADLTKAQDRVRELLTARQEALLVMAGMLN